MSERDKRRQESERRVEETKRLAPDEAEAVKERRDEERQDEGSQHAE